MKRKAKGSGSSIDWVMYKTLRNAVTSMIRESKKRYVSESISNNEGKLNAMWKSLRRIIPKNVNDSGFQKIIIDNTEITG